MAYTCSEPQAPSTTKWVQGTYKDNDGVTHPCLLRAVDGGEDDQSSPLYYFYQNEWFFCKFLRYQSIRGFVPYDKQFKQIKLKSGALVTRFAYHGNYGLSLKQFLKERNPSEEVRLAILRKLFEGLQVMHANNLVFGALMEECIFQNNEKKEWVVLSLPNVKALEDSKKEEGETNHRNTKLVQKHRDKLAQDIFDLGCFIDRVLGENQTRQQRRLIKLCKRVKADQRPILQAIVNDPVFAQAKAMRQRSYQGLEASMRYAIPCTPLARPSHTMHREEVAIWPTTSHPLTTPEPRALTQLRRGKRIQEQ